MSYTAEQLLRELQAYAKGYRSIEVTTDFARGCHEGMLDLVSYAEQIMSDEVIAGAASMHTTASDEAMRQFFTAATDPDRCSICGQLYSAGHIASARFGTARGLND